MFARIRTSLDEKEKGFTLIELLVVIIIIGILAAIAIPLFLNQRRKAVDAAARADVSTIGKEVATWYVDHTAVPFVTLAPAVGSASAFYTLAAATSTSQADKISNASAGVTLATVATLNTPALWCVGVTVVGGTITDASYSSANGLQNNACP